MNPQGENFGRLSRRVARHGAWLFGAGLLTGIWSAAALTHTVEVALPKLALAAHLNGLLGGLWLVAVSVTLPMLRYSERQASRMAGCISVSTWGNWLITLVASFLGVDGLSYNDSRANNLIAILLQSVVVLPALVGAALWIRGFYGPNRRVLETKENR